MKKLVFIEGVSGVGKTLTAKKLCGALQGLGHAACAYLEGDYDNPLELCWFAHLTKAEFDKLIKSHPEASTELIAKSVFEKDYVLTQYQTKESRFFPAEIDRCLRAREVCYKPQTPVPLQRFTEIFQNRWARLRENGLVKQMDYVLFDGALFHHQINDLLRNYSAGEEEIARHLAVLLQTVKELDPLLIYLSAPDVKARLDEARISRKQPPATTEQLAFWENRKRMDLTVGKRLTIEPHTIPVTGDDWEAVRESALKLILS